jgi:hypothetical protein
MKKMRSIILIDITMNDEIRQKYFEELLDL